MQGSQIGRKWTYTNDKMSSKRSEGYFNSLANRFRLPTIAWDYSWSRPKPEDWVSILWQPIESSSLMPRGIPPTMFNPSSESTGNDLRLIVKITILLQSLGMIDSVKPSRCTSTDSWPKARWRRRSTIGKWRNSLCPHEWWMSIRLSDIFPWMSWPLSTNSKMNLL